MSSFNRKLIEPVTLPYATNAWVIACSDKSGCPITTSFRTSPAFRQPVVGFHRAGTLGVR